MRTKKLIPKNLDGSNVKNTNGTKKEPDEFLSKFINKYKEANKWVEQKMSDANLSRKNNIRKVEEKIGRRVITPPIGAPRLKGAERRKNGGKCI